MGCCMVTSVGAVRPLRRVRGTVASTGARRYSSRSTRPRRRLSTRSRPKATSRPRKRPKNEPRMAFVLGFGLAGAPGRLAALTTRAGVVDVELGHVGQDLAVGRALVLQAAQRRLGLGLGGAAHGGGGQALRGLDDLGVDRVQRRVGVGDPGVTVLRGVVRLQLQVGVGEGLGAGLGAELRLVAAGEVEELGGTDHADRDLPLRGR